MADFEKQLADMQAQLDALRKQSPSNKLSIIAFSGDLDKALAAFVIATGAVAMGMEAIMFFTFWGTPLLRDKNKRVGGKDAMSKMFGQMLPNS